MRETNSLAYSLSQAEDGWRWCVYDEDGVTVADGAHVSQGAAQAAVERTLRDAGMDIGAAA
jgi:thiamine monophosphate synthase